MYTKMKKFISIFKIELEDIEADLETLIDLHRQKEEKHIITEYVSKENACILKQEIEALKKLLLHMPEMPSPAAQSLEEIQNWILDFFRTEITKRDYPMALWYVIERKAQKVRKYLEE